MLYGLFVAELPASFGLHTESRPDGRLNIVGNTDAGEPYTARVTDGPSVTEADIQSLRDNDREAYPGMSKDKAVRSAVKKLVGEPQPKPSLDELTQQALSFDDGEWIEAAEPVVHAGFEKKGTTIGSTRKYRRNYDLIKW